MNTPEQPESRLNLCIGLTTFPDAHQARQFAEAAVEKGLAACAQVEASVESFYFWQGKVCADRECRIMLKFPAHQSSALLEFLQKMHPYKVPQWVFMRADGASADYAEWVSRSGR